MLRFLRFRRALCPCLSAHARPNLVAEEYSSCYGIAGRYPPYGRSPALFLPIRVEQKTHDFPFQRDSVFGRHMLKELQRKLCHQMAHDGSVLRCHFQRRRVQSSVFPGRDLSNLHQVLQLVVLSGPGQFFHGLRLHPPGGLLGGFLLRGGVILTSIPLPALAWAAM